MDTSRKLKNKKRAARATDHEDKDQSRNVDVVLLAGTVGYEVSWTCGWSRHALPLPGTTVVESLLSKLCKEFDGSYTICANGHTDTLKHLVSRVDGFHEPVHFVQDTVPRGTAGCLKMCEPHVQGNTIFLATGAIYLEDDPTWMVQQHRQSGNALTVFCNTNADHPSRPGFQQMHHPTGLYCCDPAILQYIRTIGFQDLKEQLIPVLQRAGLRVGIVKLKQPAHEIIEWDSYLHVVTQAIKDMPLESSGYQQLAPDIWCGEDVEIASTARIIGPAVLGRGCRLGEHAMVVGPAILGDDCHVEQGAWAIRVVVPDKIHVTSGISVTDQFLAPTHLSSPTNFASSQVEIESMASEKQDSIPESSDEKRSAVSGRAWAMVSVLAVLFGWAFQDTWANLWSTWQDHPDYSAGQLVPVASLFMIYTQRHRFKDLHITLRTTGMAVFALGMAMHFMGTYYLYSSLQNFGMVICINGLVMSLIGTRKYKHITFPMLFLFLMLPFPWVVHDAVMFPLQGLGAASSETILEILGVPVARYGHVLEVAGHKVTVAEACSGLRMALAFLIVTGVAVYFAQRPKWQKSLVLMSSIPIALACNVLRIVASACLFHFGYDSLAEGAFHDAAGMIMMPIALGLIALEFWLLSNLVFTVDHSDVMMARMKKPQPVTVRG